MIIYGLSDLTLGFNVDHEKGDKYKVTKPYLLKKSEKVFPGLVNGSNVSRIISVAAGQTIIVFE